jgi:hypothetical protein
MSPVGCLQKLSPSLYPQASLIKTPKFELYQDFASIDALDFGVTEKNSENPESSWIDLYKLKRHIQPLLWQKASGPIEAIPRAQALRTLPCGQVMQR